MHPKPHNSLKNTRVPSAVEAPFTRIRWFLLGSLILGIANLSACGPYRSGAALQDAEHIRATVSTLKSEGRTHRRAEYAIAKGDAFLYQAKLSAGHSDHTGAIEFAQVARESFVQAQILLERDTKHNESPAKETAPHAVPTATEFTPPAQAQTPGNTLESPAGDLSQ